MAGILSSLGGWLTGASPSAGPKAAKKASALESAATQKGIGALMSGQKQAVGAEATPTASYGQLMGEGTSLVNPYISAVTGDPSGFQGSQEYKYLQQLLPQIQEGVSRVDQPAGQYGTYGVDLANAMAPQFDKAYQDYLAGLFPGFGVQETAAGGQQNIAGNLGNIYGRTAQGINLDYTNLGQQQASNLIGGAGARQATQSSNAMTGLAALFGLGQLGLKAFG